MKSYIFQLQSRPIATETLLTPYLVKAGDLTSIDYSETLSPEETIDALRRLVDYELPEGMFTYVNGDSYITYHGGIESEIAIWVKAIQKAAELIRPDNALQWIGPAYQLQKTIVNPLCSDYLFVTEGWSDAAIAYKSEEFYRMVNRLEPGDKIYIGNVLSYHF